MPGLPSDPVKSLVSAGIPSNVNFFSGLVSLAPSLIIWKRSPSRSVGVISTALAVVIIVVALGFDFTNGFHDSGNAIATSISTRALTPRVALAMAAFFNIIGALISTKVAELESEDFLRARIADCARVVDLDRLAISPQCGFSSSEKGNTIMTYDQAVAKLRRVVDVARKVWPE